jgi:hypothetical protein
MKDRAKTALSITCGLAVALALIMAQRSRTSSAPGPITQSPASLPNPASPNPAPTSAVPAAIFPAPATASLRPIRVAAANPQSLDDHSTAKPRKKTKHPGQPKTPPPVFAPDARFALALVGSDPQAEDVWLNAINNPFIPPDERKDLIEDLNEDGFADPHHISPEEMPLVMNRIRLIERIAPDSMDDVNAAAFNEAYKDLTHMLTDPNSP